MKSRRRIVRDLWVGGIVVTIVMLLLTAAIVYPLHGVEKPIVNCNHVFLVYTHATIIIATLGMAFSFLSIYAMLKVNESLKVQDLNSIYAKDEMMDIVRRVANVGKRWNDGESTKPEFVVRTPGNNPDGRIVIKNIAAFWTVKDGKNIEKLYSWTESEDADRRKLKNYFLDIIQLYEIGYISRQSVIDICRKDAITLFFKVIEPMERIINEMYNYEPFRDLMMILGKTYSETEDRTYSHDVKGKYEA